MPALTPIQIVAMVIASVGGIHDLINCKIPNWLTFGGAAVALAMHFASGGMTAAAWSVAGWVCAVALSLAVKLLPVVFKMYTLKDLPIGFGDTKLLGAMGAFVGPHLVPIVFFYFAMFYGCFSFFQFARLLPWRQLALTFTLPKGVSKVKSIDVEKVRAAGQTKIPIGPAIALGTICAIVFEKPTMWFLGFG